MGVFTDKHTIRHRGHPRDNSRKPPDDGISRVTRQAWGYFFKRARWTGNGDMDDSSTFFLELSPLFPTFHLTLTIILHFRGLFNTSVVHNRYIDFSIKKALLLRARKSLSTYKIVYFRESEIQFQPIPQVNVDKSYARMISYSLVSSIAEVWHLQK